MKDLQQFTFNMADGFVKDLTYFSWKCWWICERLLTYISWDCWWICEKIAKKWVSHCCDINKNLWMIFFCCKSNTWHKKSQTCRCLLKCISVCVELPVLVGTKSINRHCAIFYMHIIEAAVFAIRFMYRIVFCHHVYFSIDK